MRPATLARGSVLAPIKLTNNAYVPCVHNEYSLALKPYRHREEGLQDSHPHRLVQHDIVVHRGIVRAWASSQVKVVDNAW
jgi:hypothetical protein